MDFRCDHLETNDGFASATITIETGDAQILLSFTPSEMLRLSKLLRETRTQVIRGVREWEQRRRESRAAARAANLRDEAAAAVAAVSKPTEVR